MNRRAIQDAVRIVVKVGSSSLTTPDGVLDQNRLYSLVDALAEQVAAGKQIVLVTSGAVWPTKPATSADRSTSTRWPRSTTPSVR